jgi:hypothetical protein
MKCSIPYEALLEKGETFFASGTGFAGYGMVEGSDGTGFDG